MKKTTLRTLSSNPTRANQNDIITNMRGDVVLIIHRYHDSEVDLWYNETMTHLKQIFAASTVLALVLTPAFFAHAEGATTAPASTQDTTETATTPDAQITTPADVPVVNPNQDMINRLAALKKQQQDPSTGWFTQIILSIKIRELENKLNLQKALL